MFGTVVDLMIGTQHHDAMEHDQPYEDL